METENQEYLVIALAKAGDFENAERLLQDIEAKSKLKLLLLKAAFEMNKSGGRDIEKAYQYLIEAKNIDPNNKDVLEALADNCEKYRDRDAAINYYNKLLEIEPDNLRYLGMKAGLLSSMGFYKEAIENYEKILKSDSIDCDIINEIATLYEKIGNRQEAINCYDKLIQFCPSYPFAKDQMHKLMYKLIAYA